MSPLFHVSPCLFSSLFTLFHFIFSGLFCFVLSQLISSLVASHLFFFSSLIWIVCLISSLFIWSCPVSGPVSYLLLFSHFVSSHLCTSLYYSWSRLHRWCNHLAGGNDSDNYLKCASVCVCVCVCVVGAGTDTVTHHCVSAKSIKRTQLMWRNFCQTKKINTERQQCEQHAHTNGYICASNNSNNTMGKIHQTSVIFLCLCLSLHLTHKDTYTAKSHKW